MLTRRLLSAATARAVMVTYGNWWRARHLPLDSVPSDQGGTFTTPPASSLGTGATDHWTATAPSSGAITITYAFDGTHSVTFTDAGTTQSCAITPAGPGYTCTTGGTTEAPPSRGHSRMRSRA
jgi:hypothetical protein